MIWNKIANFFTIKDSENYCAAIDKMSQIRGNISDVLVVIPDVTVAELVFIQDKWQKLPSDLGENVRLMGLEISNDLKTVLTEFNQFSKIYGHEHSKNYEFLYVLNGSIDIFINNDKITLFEDDSFIVHKNELHAVTSDLGANVITTYSTNITSLTDEKFKIQKFINKYKN